MEMEKRNNRKARTFIKDIFTKNKTLKIFYLLVIIFLCVAPSMRGLAKITTPSRDAYHLYELAQGVETEAELRNFEHTYHEMELAYRQCYDGATAIKFRLMTQSIAEGAALRREGFRTIEDAIANAEQTLTTSLDDRDAAWQVVIPSQEEALVAYNKILDNIVNTHMSMRSMIVESIKYYEKVQAANYPQDMLNKHTAIADEIAQIEDKLNDYRVEARQYNIAYGMKYGQTFSNSLLLQRYIDAFDGNYTRINAGVGYGDVEYVMELLELATNHDELQQIEGIQETIHSAFIADGQDGYAMMFTERLKEPAEKAFTRVDKLDEYEYYKSGFAEIDWEGYWSGSSVAKAPVEEDAYANFDAAAFWN